MTPFRGAASSTVSLAVTSTTGRVQISATVTPGDYRIYNDGTVPVFVRDGDSTVTATTSNMPIAPGSVEVLTFGGTHLAGITSTGTANLYITPGDGI